MGRDASARRGQVVGAEKPAAQLRRLRGELRYWEDQLGGARKEVVLGGGAVEEERMKACADRIEALESKIEALEQLLRGH